MYSTLEDDRRQLESILQQTLSMAQQYFEGQHAQPPGRHVHRLPPTTLPDTGWGAARVLEYFQREYAGLINNSAGPRYFGFVTGGSTPASVAADWLVSTYDQNACGSFDSIAPQIEHQTIDFFRQLFGLDAAYFGSFVTGATLSNFVSLTLGRQWAGEQQGVDISQQGLGAAQPIAVLSGTAHSSVVKSLSMAGFGRHAWIKVNVQAEREAVDLAALEQALQHTTVPPIVVANAGTVNTVDFDDLEAIGALKQRYNFWLHVDAAFGGFAACSDRYRHLLQGINHADSITIDAHKWLNVPYDAAMQFTRHRDLQLKVFQNSAAYLGDPMASPDFFHYTPENSRRWRALPSWFTLLAYGREGYRDIVERNCDAAQQLGRFLHEHPGFELLAPVRMNVVCFTLSDAQRSPDQIRTFLDAIRDDGEAFFTPTVYKGIPAIRAAISNWQTSTDDIHQVINALKRVSTTVASPNRQ